MIKGSYLLLAILGISLLGKSQPTITWSKVSTLPSDARDNFGYFLINSNFYIVGGVDSQNNFHQDVWVYNIDSNRWSPRDTFPIKSKPLAFAINGVGYACTGNILDSMNSSICSNNFFQYNISLDKWINKANFPGEKRYAASFFVYNNKAYVGLGHNCGHPLNDLWQYDPNTDRWTAKDSFPSSAFWRYITNTVVVDTFAYFIGGATNGGISTEAWRYSILGDKWSKIADLPDEGLCATVNYSLNNHFLAGYGLDSMNYLGKKMYLYNIKTNSWSNVNCVGFLDSTADGATFIYEGKGYYFGGYKKINSSSYKDLWSFDATQLINYLGVEEVESKTDFRVYPNPVNTSGAFQIATPHRGEISFFNTVGQLLFTAPLEAGFNQFSTDKMNGASEVVMYRAILKGGSTENGKLVLLR